MAAFKIFKAVIGQAKFIHLQRPEPVQQISRLPLNGMAQLICLWQKDIHVRVSLSGFNSGRICCGAATSAGIVLFVFFP